MDENSNKEIDEVAGIFAQIAADTGCAIDLVHHTGKAGSRGMAGDADRARGASSLIGAVRAARTLDPMMADEAAELGLSERREWFLRATDAKGNMSAPGRNTKWFERHSVALPNGDSVGVIQGRGRGRRNP